MMMMMMMMMTIRRYFVFASSSLRTRPTLFRRVVFLSSIRHRQMATMSMTTVPSSLTSSLSSSSTSILRVFAVPAWSIGKYYGGGEDHIVSRPLSYYLVVATLRHYFRQPYVDRRREGEAINNDDDDKRQSKARPIPSARGRETSPAEW